LNILTVLDARISGVLGIGSVWAVIAGGLLNTGDSPREMGGSRGGLSWALGVGREYEDELLPNAAKTEVRLGGNSNSLDREEAIEARGVAAPWLAIVCFRLNPGIVKLIFEFAALGFAYVADCLSGDVGR
jgi:hypothetical protein